MSELGLNLLFLPRAEMSYFTHQTETFTFSILQVISYSFSISLRTFLERWYWQLRYNIKI